jgi:hypothetical protein
MIISLVITVLVLGVLWWAIDALPGIDPTFKQIAKIILVVATVIYLLTAFFPGRVHLP